MTPNEINAWARMTNLRRECAGKQVLIRREDGQYLSLSGATWTKDRAAARVHDFDGDQVAQQLHEVEVRYQAKWTVEILTKI